MYIMFPIGWMYYFGTNLESRFSVPDFWPEPGTTHRIPFEKEELDQLAEQLKAQRLEKRRRRLERVRAEMKADGVEETRQIDGKVEEVEQKKQVAVSEGTFGVGAIEKWAGGK